MSVVHELTTSAPVTEPVTEPVAFRAAGPRPMRRLGSVLALPALLTGLALSLACYGYLVFLVARGM